ncbi:MAG: OmpW family outer membrane protein [Caulobacter sp.]|nr:OmpW family outer membrane protein [Caulobacter sp.]
MKTATLIAAGLLAATVAGPALAQDYTPKAKGAWLVTARVSDVAPSESGSIRTAAGVDTGLDVEVSDYVVPTLGFTYFFTDNIAVEGILGTSKHEVSAKGAGGMTRVLDTWVVPPVVTVQYHFNPKGRISPYVGAGVNAMIFYGGKDRNGFDVDLDNGFGYALQAGVDIAVKGDWSVNLDAKKVFFETDADINNGALKSSVALDPWVISAGVTRRF